MTQSVRCKICRATASLFSSALVLSKHQVSYYQCGNCGFVQTEDPYWLDEAYSEAISAYDIGSVNRAIVNASVCERYILQCFDCSSKFVDYGAGYGIMVRRMRDLGFDFYWYDRFCENLFARHFEADMSGVVGYELLTAFEVFEHLENPRKELETMLTVADNLLFSTELIPPSNPRPGEWWYYFPLSGQHIAFYTQQSLHALAESYGLHLTTDGRCLHLLTKLPPRKLPVRDRIAMKLLGDVRFLRRQLRKESLLADDFAALSGVRFN